MKKNHFSSECVARRLMLLVIVITVFGVIGCQPGYRAPEIVSGPERFSVDEALEMTSGLLGRSLEDRPIVYSVLGGGDDVVLVIATIHGNEKAGTPIVHRIEEYLKANRQLLSGRKVVLVPNVNPDGCFHNRRFNARGVDLNRNFSAVNRVNNRVNGASAFSEPESRIIEKLISEHSPDRIIVFHEPLDCLDYDGPGFSLAMHMGNYCNLEVSKLGARPGSLGSYAGVGLGIATITVELKKEDGELGQDALWGRYGTMLLAGITYPFDPPVLSK